MSIGARENENLYRKHKERRFIRRSLKIFTCQLCSIHPGAADISYAQLGSTFRGDVVLEKPTHLRFGLHARVAILFT
jgi:hypothetical protein